MPNQTHQLHFSHRVILLQFEVVSPRTLIVYNHKCQSRNSEFQSKNQWFNIGLFNCKENSSPRTNIFIALLLSLKVGFNTNFKSWTGSLLRTTSVPLINLCMILIQHMLKKFCIFEDFYLSGTQWWQNHCMLEYYNLSTLFYS